MSTKRSLAVSGVLFVLLTAGITTLAVTTSTPSAPKSSAVLGCLSDPSTAIQAEPAGGIWNGNNACYNLPNGLQISKPVTVENATFHDTATTPTKVPGQQLGWKPVIRVKATPGVNLYNLVLTGMQHTGPVTTKNGVGQAGLKIDGSSAVNVTNVAVSTVGGDGLTLSFEPGEAENTNISVNGFSADNVGRVGVTVSNCSHCTLTNVQLTDVTTAGVDFESDGATVGSDHITFNHLTADRGVFMQGALFGPICFNDSNFSGNIALVRSAAASSQPVTFTGGTILMNNRFSGTPPAAIWVSGPGNLTFTNVAFGRQPGRQPPTGPAWSVTGGGLLTFNHSPVLPPYGSNDPLSAVVVNP
jgi:uncharacterized repeat protein (TIGR01451 family)